MNAQFNFSSVSRWILAIFFVAAGLGHFLRPALYFQMMPPWIPWPLFMIYMSGFFEIFFGALVLPLKTRPLAGWGLIALLIAVFPANIYMAQHPEIFTGIQPWMAWARLPFQLVFIFWVWKVTFQESKGD